MKRFLSYGVAALLMLGVFSCKKEETGAATGSVSIRFFTVGIQDTKATTPGNGVVEDGGGIALDEGNPDLVILLANAQGNIVSTYPGNNTSLESSSATQAVIQFSSLTQGNYTVYAFGNTRGLWDMTTTGDDTITPSGLTNLNTATQVEALRFKPMDTSNGLSPKEGRLPVSAKGSLTVSAGRNGETYLELLRCVAKVTALIKNNTGGALQLFNYMHTVMGISPNSGYVIPHQSDFPGTPENLVADPCTKFSDPDYTIDISDEGSAPYDWYVFPSQGPYTVDISFTLFKDNVGGTQKDYVYSNLPVINWRAEDVLQLGRNQHLTVSTYISKGITVSFNFAVNEWETHTEYVTFD